MLRQSFKLSLMLGQWDHEYAALLSSHISKPYYEIFLNETEPED